MVCRWKWVLLGWGGRHDPGLWVAVWFRLYVKAELGRGGTGGLQNQRHPYPLHPHAEEECRNFGFLGFLRFYGNTELRKYVFVEIGIYGFLILFLHEIY